jgi:hypothetical protein
MTYASEEIATEILVFIIRAGIIEYKPEINDWDKKKKERKLKQNFNFGLACVIFSAV